MKIFFIGNHWANLGPANVNKYLISNLKSKVRYQKSKNKIISLVEIFLKTMTSNIVIISGMQSKVKYLFFLIRLFRKKSIYIMHGCARYENEINKLSLSKKSLKNEEKVLKSVNLILCVSKRYMEWTKGYYPQYKHKVYYLNNGVEFLGINNKQNEEKIYDIAVDGGNRIQKNNLIVCEAIKKINSKGSNLKLNIYGSFYENNLEIKENDFIKIKGHISKEQYLKELSNTKLFILNSTMESFGLSAVDALTCGCDVLISSNVGVTSIMQLEETDIINDPTNLCEICDKISYNLSVSNNARILRSIDLKDCSWENAANKLIKICEYLYLCKSLDIDKLEKHMIDV